MEAAYHEAGHAVIAALLGGKIVSVSIEENSLDTPWLAGLAAVAWPIGWTETRQIGCELMTLLAGPAAEMVYTGEPLHPATVAQWRGDWQAAQQLLATKIRDERKRIAALERTCSDLFSRLQEDRLWQAISEVADLLDSHETIEGEEVHDCVSRWITG